MAYAGSEHEKEANRRRNQKVQDETNRVVALEKVREAAQVLHDRLYGQPEMSVDIHDAYEYLEVALSQAELVGVPSVRSERPPQFPDKQFAIRKKDAPDYYLSDEASLDDLDFALTRRTSWVAFYGSPEMARVAWRTFFKMEEGEVVRWSSESIEVVA